MSSDGSSSDTDADARSIADDSVNVTHRLHATRTPFITSCCVELAFCALMSSWMSDNDHYTVFFRLHSETIGSKKIIVFVWAVFAVSAMVRFWCLCLTAKSSLARNAGRWLTVIYMFFGTVNWLLYLTAYYIAHDNASNPAKTHRVNIDLRNAHYLSASVKKCLLEHNWSYEACDIHVESVCTMPYNSSATYGNGECVTTVDVAGIPCCISEVLKLEKPHLTVLGKDIPVSIVFMLIKWMSILLVGWVLRHGYFAAGVGTGEFSETAYLDILDAVIFSENLNEDLVRCPGYGISRSGRPQGKNVWPYYYLYATFVTAFTTVLFSQMLYTLLAPKKEKEETSDEEDVSPDEAIKQTVPTLQTAQTVQVQTTSLFDSRSSLLRLGGTMRPGRVLGRDVSDVPGIYRVQFDDELEPKEMVVSIDALASPHGMMTMKGVQQDLREAAKQGCSGWFRVRELCEGTHAERFEKKAQLLDAFRSLLCLQIPFLLWRLYFDAFTVDLIQFAGRSLLIAKNVIWALYDSVIIAACLNKDATIFGVKPMAVFSMAADTKFGKLWVGPSGMVAMLAAFGGILRKSNLTKRIEQLQKYKDWLLFEKDCASPSNLEICEAFDSKLQHVQVELAVAEEKLQFIFP